MKHLDVEQLRAFCDQAQAEGTPVMLLDVREPWEVAHAAIDLPGVAQTALPMNDIPRAIADAGSPLDPAQTIVCICHHGARSASVAMYLERQGFDDVVNLTGGIDAWSTRVDPAVARY
jgi:rhodanese-related sulfurtransferase